jgi:4-hydroxy-3-polyprenylbenzoate decarboxylase
MSIADRPIVVALTGASGAPYGVRLVEVLLQAGRKIHLLISPAAAEVFLREMDRVLHLNETRFDPQAFFGYDFAYPPGSLLFHHHTNFSAPIASGSYLTAGMVICPCSLGTLAAIAHGLSENLIHRAADVHLKERRPLILVPRETPLGLIPLRNMVAATEAGAVILPAMPAFYTRPQTLQDMIDFVVARICDHLQIAHHLAPRWGQSPPSDALTPDRRSRD